MKINWQDRVSDDLKQKINIEMAAKVFKQKFETSIKQGVAHSLASRGARQSMAAMLKQKGVENAAAIHFLHVCEVLPYNGCGCCQHRRPPQGV